MSGEKKEKESNPEEPGGDTSSVDEKPVESTSMTSELVALQKGTTVTDEKEEAYVEMGACSESKENRSTLHKLASAQSKSYDGTSLIFLFQK